MMIRETLNGIWRLVRMGDDREYSLEMPGSVYSVFSDAGVVENPCDQNNGEHMHKRFPDHYELVRSYPVSAELLSSEKIELVCESSDTVEELSVNGTSVTVSRDENGISRFSVRELLCAGENEIRIVCVPASYGREQDFSAEGKDSKDRLESGVWRGIELFCYSEARIEDVQMKQQNEGGRVTLLIDAALEIWETKNYKVSLTLSPSYHNGKKLPATEVLAKTAIVMAGNTHLATELTVEKPRFWRPEGQGDQDLYNLHVSLKPAGIAAGGAAALQITKSKPIDEREYTIALREDGA